MAPANRPPRLEVCVESASAAAAAIAGGAGRLELCSSLADGGLTPSLGLVQQVISLAKSRAAAAPAHAIPVHGMVRPRGGSFTYGPLDLSVMSLDIAAFRAAGAAGVVVGVLTPELTVDVPVLRRLVAEARPMSLTFHRAFDLVPPEHMADALEELVAAGVDVLLTSGGASSLDDGADMVRRLVDQARGRIAIMGGAGVRLENAARLWKATQVDTLHASLRTPLPGLELRGGGEGAATMGARDTDVLYTVREEDVRAVASSLDHGR